MKYRIIILVNILVYINVYSQDFVQYPQPFNPTYQDTLKNLKVVLILGGDEWHLSDDMEEHTKKCFSKYNIKVRTVKNSRYIEKECKDADIIIYNGHGGLKYDTVPVGFYFSDGTGDYNGTFINRNLSNTLNKNSLIIYNTVCTGAGSSADDKIDIGFDEAKRRVYYNGSVYPETSAYYANNDKNMLDKFLYYFLGKKMTLQETYKMFDCNCYDKGFRMDSYKEYNINNKTIKINKLKLSKKTFYGHAYYADPNYNISSIFKSKPVKYIK